jgi:N-acyl amino acid synthase FeeM
MLDRVSSTSSVFTKVQEASEVSAFTRTILNLLDRVEYRFCDSGEDLEAIYRLRYKSYRAHGLVSDSSEHLIYDKLDEASNCYRFGIFIDGELASTIRIHHLSGAEPFSPAMSVFGDMLLPRLRRGDSFIDPSRLAADPQLASAHRGLPYISMRLAVAACNYFDATSCLTMVREEHEAFYRRVINAVQIAEPRPYASVNVYGLLCESNCEANMEKILARFPFFYSTAFEQRLLFKRPKRGETAPLTILPTAKYLLAAA